MPDLVFGACCAASAGLLFVAINLFGMRQFPGEDGGVTMNVAWQLWLHREPYADVVAAFPPLFLLGARGAFSLFGQTWQALVLCTATYAAVTFVLQVLLLRRLGVSRSSALLIALGVQAMTTVPASFWWYNQVTAVAACLFATSALLLYERPDDRVARAALGFTTAALLLAKPNIAVPLLLGAFVALLVARATRRSALVALGGGLLVAAFAFVVVLGATPAAYARALADAGGRATDSDSWMRFAFEHNAVEASWTFALLIPVAAALAIAWAAGLVRRHEALLLGTAAIVSLIGIATNNDYNAVDLALAVAMALTVVGVSARAAPAMAGPARRARVLGAVAAVAAVAIIITGVVSGQDRDRIAAASHGVYYEDIPLTPFPDELRVAAFVGLHTGPRLIEVSRDLIGVAERIHADRGDFEPNIYFGPRLQWAYPALRERPAIGIPVYWEPFQMPSARSTEMVERFSEANIDYAIFLRNDYTFLPVKMIALLEREYLRSDATPTLTVWHRPGTRV